MRKGSIIGQIVAEISLQHYEDDSPLSGKAEYAIEKAIPDDIRPWFLAQITEKPLTGKQGLKLVSWIFKNTQKAIIDLEKIKKLRRARKEQIIGLIVSNMPTPAIMANVTREQIEGSNFSEDITFSLVPYLSEIVKRDEDTVTVAIQWSLRQGDITSEDLHWLLRYCKPTSEYIQLHLI